MRLDPAQIELQGLGLPLSAHMVALQGLWPVSEAVVGGVTRPTARKKQPSAEDQTDEARQEFLRQDDESLLFALVAIVASRRLH